MPKKLLHWTSPVRRRGFTMTLSKAPIAVSAKGNQNTDGAVPLGFLTAQRHEYKDVQY